MWIRDTFGGRGDVCLAGTHSGIIIVYVAILIVNNGSEFDGLGTIKATGMLLAIPPILFTLFASRQKHHRHDRRGREALTPWRAFY